MVRANPNLVAIRLENMSFFSGGAGGGGGGGGKWWFQVRVR